MAKSMIYVAQFGAIWKLTVAEWKAIVADGLAGLGYELPLGGQLERRPPFIVPDRDDGGFWNAHHAHRLVEPLDWCEEDWRYEAQDHFPELLIEEGV